MTVTTTAPEPAVEARGRPIFTRLQVLGLLLMAAGPTLIVVGEIIAFGTEGLGALAFVGPVVALSLLGAGLAWRFGTWAKVLGVVLGLLMLAMFGSFIVANLRYANSFLDFIPLVTAGVGAVFAVGFGIAAIVRRRYLQVEATPTERRVASVTLGALALLAVVSGVATLLAVETVDAAAAGGAIRVDMREFAFDPLEIDVDNGGRILVHNSDPVLHTFTVPELGIDRPVLPGSDTLIDIEGARAGSFTVYCKPHSDTTVADPADAGMAARLTVR